MVLNDYIHQTSHIFYKILQFRQIFVFKINPQALILSNDTIKVLLNKTTSYNITSTFTAPLLLVKYLTNYPYSVNFLYT
jgi:hypothetical protein